MQTEAPHWLAESYASAIDETDIGPVNRAITGSWQTEGVILSSFDPSAKFIDYGAGYGVFVRLMRDRGFDFYWQDIYCQNLFARHFVAQPGTKYELLTAFEVFEHLVDPLAEVERMLSYSRNLLFSTLLMPANVSMVEDWWYFSPGHGQHVAFYTVPALEIIAKRFALHLSSNGRDTHLLSERPISKKIFNLSIKDSRLLRVARPVLRRRMARRSLLVEDFEAVSGHKL